MTEIEIIDTHAHYDDKAFDADRDRLLRVLGRCNPEPQEDPAASPEASLADNPAADLTDGPAEESGDYGFRKDIRIAAIINVGASMRGAEESIALARKWPFIYAAVGIHPDDTGCLDEEALAHIKELAAEPKCVAIGEIGLDYHWMVEPKETQQSWFVRQMHLAKELGLPINVHSRDAAQDTFDLIKKEHAGSTGGIIHCYSGSAELAREYIKMGYYLGIGGVVTFKNGKVLKRVVEETPLERLVTETDCPYLAPVPHRGERNCSGYIPYVVEEIARLKGLETEETARILCENARKIYRLC